MSFDQTSTVSTGLDSSLSSDNSSVPWQQCQASKVSWDEAYTSAYQPRKVTYTSAVTDFTFNLTVLYGTGDIYTTSDGFSRAHSFTATSSQVVDPTITYSTGTYTSTTVNNVSFTLPSPTCTIDFAQCSLMFSSYLISLGLPATAIHSASIPSITPVPSNSPRCSVGTGVASWSIAPADAGCSIHGNTVQVFYWPPATALSAMSGNNSSQVVTQVYGNRTFTSPSVCLSFDTLYAATYTDLDQSCTVSNPPGATSVCAAPGGGAASVFGQVYTNVLVSAMPFDTSSVLYDVGPSVDTSSIIDVIARDRSDFSEVLGQLYFMANRTAEPVNFDELATPSARAYYLTPNQAPGCAVTGLHSLCATIFDGAYKPQLMVPSQVRTLDPSWERCNIPLYGAYDPPHALTQHTAAAAPVPSSTSMIAPSVTPATPNLSPAAPTVDPTTTRTVPIVSELPNPPPAPQSEKSGRPVASPTDPGSSGDDKSSQRDPASPVPSPGDGIASASSIDTPPRPNAPPPPPSAASLSGATHSAEVSDPAGVLASNDGGDHLRPAATASASASRAPDEPSPSDPAGGIISAIEGNGDPSQLVPQESTGLVPNNPSFGSSSSGRSGGIDTGSHSNLVVPAASNADTAPLTDLISDSRGPSNRPPSPISVSNAGNEASRQKTNPSEGTQQTNNPNVVSSSATPGPQNAATVVIDSDTLTAKQLSGVSEAIVFGSQTLRPEGPAATVNGQTVKENGNGAIIVGSNTIALTAAIPAPHDNVGSGLISIGGQQVTAVNQNSVNAVGSDTLSVGGAAATINGQVVSALYGGLQVGSTSMPLEDARTAPGPAMASVRIGGQAYTVSAAVGSNSPVAVAGHTLSAGGRPAVIDGQTISAYSGGLLIGTSTISLGIYGSSVQVPGGSLVTIGSEILTAYGMDPSNSVIAVGEHTLTAGGSAITTAGETISAASGGLEIDGSMHLMPETPEAS
ncbi:MAG: hypothetical protein M1820_001721 [Bogoriella megaspora]|nr:MAG: hypothetical protein M1820_001721 [Bogoriella megaspora]